MLRVFSFLLGMFLASPLNAMTKVAESDGSGLRMIWAPNGQLLHSYRFALKDGKKVTRNHVIFNANDNSFWFPQDFPTGMREVSSWEPAKTEWLVQYTSEHLKKFIDAAAHVRLYRTDHHTRNSSQQLNASQVWRNSTRVFNDLQCDSPFLSPDKKFFVLVSWYSDESKDKHLEAVQIFDADTRRLVKTFEHQNYLDNYSFDSADLSYYFAWSANGKFAITLRNSQEPTPIRIYDSQTLTPQSSPDTILYEKDLYAHSFAWRPQGDKLVVQGKNKTTISVWDISTATRDCTEPDQYTDTHNLGISPGGSYLATYNKSDKKIKVIPFVKPPTTLEELWGSS